MDDIGRYLKRHTEALVKELGIETAARVSGKSKATLGRYYGEGADHGDRFMPVDTVARLESAAGHPHVTAALADVHRMTLSREARSSNQPGEGGFNDDVIALSQRFAMLMTEYHQALGDGRISGVEARRMLRETLVMQEVLMDMKLHLEEESG